MTHGDVHNQILSEATGKPVEEIKKMMDTILSVAGTRANFDKEIDDAYAKQLMEELREELPGIRNWLEQGRREAAEMIGAQARNN